MDEKVGINIPKSLYSRIARLADELDVKDVNVFIVDLLREAVSKYEEELSSSIVLSEDEVEKIRERLRSLGYLD
ncbi:MAG TPA: CopG family transcriptional regulator [Thermoprotei archaeon]|nr:CopG family transcriptional regulator [Thermoprotei archaeon]